MMMSGWAAFALMEAPIITPFVGWLVWSRFAPQKSIAKLAVNMLDADDGWTDYWRGLRHSTGLTCTPDGRVVADDVDMPLNESSRRAVRRAYRRYNDRRRRESEVRAATAFAKRMDDLSRRVVPFRRGAA